MDNGVFLELEVKVYIHDRYCWFEWVWILFFWGIVEKLSFDCMFFFI